MFKNTLFKIQSLTIIVAVLIMLVKIYAFSVTRSNTILTDAAESLVNVIAALFGLFSLYLSLKPSDENHPYGHGKIEFFSEALEGILIMIAGIAILGKSIYAVLYQNDIFMLQVGIYLTIITGSINFLLGLYIKKEGGQRDSIILRANGDHLISDGITSLGILLGLILIQVTEINRLDAIIAIIFSTYIIYTGYKLMKEAISGLMDEADSELVTAIVELLNENRYPNLIDVHNFRVIKYGTDLHIDCHITIPWFLDTREAHDEVKHFEELLMSNTLKKVECFVHVDPCIPISCKICNKQNCKERIHPKDRTIKWTIENITRNEKHQV